MDKPKLEICSNREWHRVFGPVDYDWIDDCYQDDAVDVFIDELRERLADNQWDTDMARGERATCHGWNGWNLFRHKLGPVGTFGELTENQAEEIRAVISGAEQSMVAIAEQWMAETEA